MANKHDLTAGWLALKSTKVTTAAPGGALEESAAAYEAAYTHFVLPKSGFAYAFNGTILKFYKGQPKDVPPRLRTILLAEGLVT